MQSAFLFVVLGVCAVGVIGALLALATSRRDWARYGSERPTDDQPAAVDERDEEIRQMLEASNARRRRRGEPERDPAAELARIQALTDPGDELTAEIRDLVVARNHRRARRGLEPLDVDHELQRELRRLRDL